MKLPKIDLQKWFICHLLNTILLNPSQKRSFLHSFCCSYMAPDFFLCENTTLAEFNDGCWNFPVEILKHKCWFCPNLGGVLLCLELETGCKKKKKQYKATYNTDFNLCCLFHCHFQSCLLSLGTQGRVPSQQLHLPHHFPGLLPGTLLGSLPGPPGRSVPGPEFLTEGGSFRAQGRVQESAEQIWALQFRIPCACVLTDKGVKIWLWL